MDSPSTKTPTKPQPVSKAPVKRALSQDQLIKPRHERKPSVPLSKQMGKDEDDDVKLHEDLVELWECCELGDDS